MAHWLCIHLPSLPLDIFSRSDNEQQPLAVSDGGRLASVLLCNQHARRRAVCPGMPAAAARALAHDLIIRPRNRQAEQEALRNLADWAWQFSPEISLYPPDALLLEIRGSFSLFGGHEALLDNIRTGLSRLGYKASLAGAPTALAAYSLARCNSGQHIESVSRLAAALASLPTSVLDWDQNLLDSLDAMGVRRLGDVLRLPRDGLARRFGRQNLLYLDRMLGHCPDPQTPYRPPRRFRRHLQLTTEIDQAPALLFALQRLLLELCGWLQGQGAGVQDLEIVLHQREGKHLAFMVGVCKESRDAEQFTTLLRERLERLKLQEPVVEVELGAERLIKLDARSLDLFRANDKKQINLLDRLRARLGGEVVQGLSAVAEHRPEYAWTYSQPGHSRKDCNGLQRPLWLLPVPRQLKTSNGKPLLQGELKLQASRERIESGWWDEREIARDYFIATNPAGSHYWIYRELSGKRRWYLQGIFE